MRRAAVLALVTLMACARGGGESVMDAPPGPRVDATIDGNGCAMQPCAILPQCGCGGNFSCDYDRVDFTGTQCRPINLMGNEDDACTDQQECDRGYVCLGTTNGACKKYCSDTADCGAPRGQCIYQITSNSGPIAGVPKVCSSNCDPTDTTGALCPSTMKCSFVTYMGTQVVDCRAAGTGVQGTDCNGTGSGDESVCDNGFMCTKVGTDPYKCRRICTQPGQNSAQCGGMLCRTFSTPITVAGVSYGACDP